MVSFFPGFRLFWGELGGFDGSADELAHFGNVLHQTVGLGLQHDVADGCSFARACYNGYTYCIASELVELVVLGTTTDDVQLFDVERCHVLQVVSTIPLCE